MRMAGDAIAFRGPRGAKRTDRSSEISCEESIKGLNDWSPECSRFCAAAIACDERFKEDMALQASEVNDDLAQMARCTRDSWTFVIGSPSCS